jgi:hypothetical protein
MKINSNEKTLLKALFKSTEGLFIFTMYQKYNISPKDLFLAIENLSKLGYVSSLNGRLTLTMDGFNFVINNNLSFNKGKSKYDKVPNDFLGPRIEINQFYIPKLEDNTNEFINLQ